MQLAQINQKAGKSSVSEKHEVNVVVRANRKDVQIYERLPNGDCEMLLDCTSRVETRMKINVSDDAVGLLVSGDGRVEINLNDLLLLQGKS